jgi:hypothetical protein
MRVWIAMLVTACAASPAPPARPPEPLPEAVVTQPQAPRDWPAACRDIADAIERIRTQYPQLVEFRANTAQMRDCSIGYEFHTHAPTKRGGWTSATPEPDPDGIWFYIGIYDPAGPDATLQIHTQPFVANWWIGERKVMFLVKEGAQTKRAGEQLLQILQRNGMITK